MPTRRGFLVGSLSLGCWGLSGCGTLDVSGTVARLLEGASEEKLAQDLLLLTGRVSKAEIIIGGLLGTVINPDPLLSDTRLILRFSAGPEYNLRAVAAGEGDLGIVTSHAAWSLSKGDALDHVASLGGKLRIVSRLSVSALSVLAIPHIVINGIPDLAGKRVVMLKRAYSDQAFLLDLAHVQGIPVQRYGEDDPRPSTVSPDRIHLFEEYPQKIEQGLLERHFDCFIGLMTHPSPLFRRLVIHTPARPAQLLVDEQSLRSRVPGSLGVTIPVDVYPELGGVDVATVGTSDLLISSTSLPADTVYNLVKVISQNAKKLAQFPYFRGLSGDNVVENIPAPTLHAGCLKFLDEQNFLTASGLSPVPFVPPSHLFPVAVNSASPFSETLASALERIGAPGSVDVVGPSPPVETRDALQVLAAVSARQNALGLVAVWDLVTLPDQELNRLEPLTLSNIRSVLMLSGGTFQLVVTLPDPQWARRLRMTQARRVVPGLMGVPIRPHDTFTSQLDDALLEGELLLMLSGARVGVADSTSTRILQALSKWFTKHGHSAIELVPLESSSLVSSLSTSDLQALAVMDRVPSPIVQEALKTPNTQLVPISFDVLELEPMEILQPTIIPAASYLGAPDRELSSLTEPLMLISSTEVPETRIRDLHSAVIEELPRLRQEGVVTPEVDEEWMQQLLEFPPHRGVTASEPTGAVDIAVPVSEGYFTLAVGEPRGMAYRVASGVLRSHRIACGVLTHRASSCKSERNAAILPTGGDMESLRLLLAGEAELAVVRGDLLWDAMSGKGDWKRNPQPALRSVCSLYLESLTAVVAGPQHLARGPLGDWESRASVPEQGFAEKPIVNLEELNGARVSMRVDSSSAPRTNAISFFHLDSFQQRQWIHSLASDEPPPEAAFEMFRGGDLEAFFWTTHHPSEQLNSILRACEGTQVLAITGLVRDSAEVPFVYRSVIDLTPYPGLSSKKIPSLGIPKMLVAREDTDGEVVTDILNALVVGLRYLKRDFPVLRSTSTAFLRMKTFLPFHVAAEAYLGYRD